jgi:Uncharacterized protein conserved in bacteria (DUF2252)
MGRLTAWAQLRSSGRQGSSIADELVAFADASGWKQSIIEYGRSYAAQARRDYKEFVDAAARF